MSFLSNLKLVHSKKSNNLSPVAKRRFKLCNKLFEQIQLAEAKKEGRIYAPVRFKTIENKITGDRQTVEVPKRIREWWYTTENGKLNLVIKYGSKQLELAKDKNAIELNSELDLITTLTNIKLAVERGELDTQIETVSGALKSAFVK